MKTKQIESIGIVGVEVFFNHSELVAMKEFVTKLKLLDTSNKYEFLKQGENLVKEVISLFEKIVPEQVMSIAEAHDSLFALNIPKELSVTEQIMNTIDLLTDKEIF